MMLSLYIGHTKIEFPIQLPQDISEPFKSFLERLFYYARLFSVIFYFLLS